MMLMISSMVIPLGATETHELIMFQVAHGNLSATKEVNQAMCLSLTECELSLF